MPIMLGKKEKDKFTSKDRRRELGGGLDEEDCSDRHSRLT